MTTDRSAISDPSGCEQFDRARGLLANHREDEALDWFEVALDTSDDSEVKASAAAHVAALLLGFGRPWEVAAFATRVRDYANESALADMLEAAACVQLGDATGALELLGTSGAAPVPTDRWFPCSAAGFRAARVRALALAGRDDATRDELAAALCDTPDAPEVWEVVAALVADDTIAAAGYVAHLDPAHVLDVFGWIAAAPARGLDAIAEALWERAPGDRRVLAAVTLFAWRLDADRSLLWSVRLVEHHATDRSPVLERAEMAQVAPGDRVRAAIAAVPLDEPRACAALESALGTVADLDLAELLGLTLDSGCGLGDSFVVAAATSTARCLVMTAELCRRGHASEALAVLVAGLSMPQADDLTPTEFDRLVPEAERQVLAHIAFDHHDEEVAALLLSVPAAS